MPCRLNCRDEGAKDALNHYLACSAMVDSVHSAFPRLQRHCDGLTLRDMLLLNFIGGIGVHDHFIDKPCLVCTVGFVNHCVILGLNQERHDYRFDKVDFSSRIRANARHLAAQSKWASHLLAGIG